ncbi:hypothetical protein BC936DRAFT_149727, partial [Jimgerdemannia flammicorona]
MKFTSLATSAILLFAASLAQEAQAKPVGKSFNAPACYQHTIPFTQYWVPKEGLKDQDDNGRPITLTLSPKPVQLKTGGGRVIAKVSKNTYYKCYLEGTCLLNDGTLVNLDDDKKRTFLIIDTKYYRFGQGSTDKALVPFVSIAANDWPIGTTAIVKELVGKKLPNGKTHNGCVRVDDKSWSFKKCQFDFFVVEFDLYKKMNLPEKANIKQKACKKGQEVPTLEIEPPL